jgi:O-antigen/teichoic acid export membrane protein
MTAMVPTPARMLRSLWQSSALRAAGALGVSGAALACGNLMLARVLPTAEFARFALFCAIVQIGVSIGPFGVDVIMTRRRIHPGPALHYQVLLQAALAAVVLALLAKAIYMLSYTLLLVLVISITAGSVKVVPTSYFRSQQRFGAALVLTMSTNASILVAAGAALAAHASTALLPIGAMCLSLCATAWLGWRAVAAAPQTAPDASPAYPMSEAWSAVSFVAAAMILSSLDRLITPKLLGLPALATLSVLTTIAGSPFHMLHQGIGYTLVPALRNAVNRAARTKVLVHEGAVVALACCAAAVAVWALTPLIMRTVLAGRYEISWHLLVAAICVGFIKVVGSLAAAAVNALGSSAALVKLSILGWLSIGIALIGGSIGSRFGLTGLVYGIAMGWLLRALVASHLALRQLIACDEAPGSPKIVRGAGRAWE